MTTIKSGELVYIPAGFLPGAFLVNAHLDASYFPVVLMEPLLVMILSLEYTGGRALRGEEGILPSYWKVLCGERVVYIRYLTPLKKLLSGARKS